MRLHVWWTRFECNLKSSSSAEFIMALSQGSIKPVQYCLQAAGMIKIRTDDWIIVQDHVPRPCSVRHANIYTIGLSITVRLGTFEVRIGVQYISLTSVLFRNYITGKFTQIIWDLLSHAEQSLLPVTCCLQIVHSWYIPLARIKKSSCDSLDQKHFKRPHGKTSVTVTFMSMSEWKS